MTTTTDGFGVWNQLGKILPSTYNEWLKFPVTGNPIYSQSYRVSFESNNFPNTRSYAWLRPVYFVGGVEIFAQAIRVYPSPSPKWLEFPIPKDLVARGINYQNFQVMRVMARRYDFDEDWTIKLEELQG